MRFAGVVVIVLVGFLASAINGSASASDFWLECTAEQDGFQIMIDAQEEDIISFELKIKVWGKGASFSVIKEGIIAEWMLCHNYEDGHILIWAAHPYPLPLGKHALVKVPVEMGSAPLVCFSLVEAGVNERTAGILGPEQDHVIFPPIPLPPPFPGVPEVTVGGLLQNWIRAVMTILLKLFMNARECSEKDAAEEVKAAPARAIVSPRNILVSTWGEIRR